MAFAGPGESVKLIISDIEYDAISRGDIICGSQYWANVCTDFIADIQLLEFPSSILISPGFTFVLHMHTIMQTAEIFKVLKVYHYEDGKGETVTKDKYLKSEVKA